MRETIRSSRVWLGLLVVVAFGALAVGGASGFDSGAHVKRFTSHRYGYSLVVPRGWFAYPATTSVPANSSELPSVVDSSVDHFSGSDGGQIGVSATKMTPGLTLKSWAAGTPKRLQILFGCNRRPRWRAKSQGSPPPSSPSDRPAVAHSASHRLITR